MIDPHHGWNKSVKPLYIGFIASLMLTLVAYFIVTEKNFNFWPFIVGLGAVQVVCQLVFFMHLGVEAKLRWNLMLFLFMTLTTFMLIGGSIWIMNNLNYFMMPTKGM